MLREIIGQSEQKKLLDTDDISLRRISTVILTGVYIYFKPNLTY